MSDVQKFIARCKGCGRRLGDVRVPREHQACGVVFETVCRSNTCRRRVIEIRFDPASAADARERGY